MDFISLLFYFLVIIPSAIIHEYAHGWMAYQLGDPTAKYAGRLTIDPRAHIDKWGTIIMPIGLFLLTGGRFMFAYAKPVPFNPYNLKDQKWGPALVGVAGPLANFLLAACFGLLVRMFPASLFAPFFAIIVMANITLMVFNLFPIPALDGGRLYFILIEGISGYKLKPSTERAVHGVAFLILIFLVILIAINDIAFVLERRAGIKLF